MGIVSPKRLREYLGKSAETTPDNVLLPFCEAAGDALERYCRRHFEKKTQTECIPLQDGRTAFLSRRPVISIRDVWKNKPLDTAYSLPPSEYEIDKAAGILRLRNSTLSSNIYVRYQGGFHPIPPAITQATLMLAGYYWQRSQNNSDGLQGESLGSYSVQYDCDAWPAHVLSLMRDFKSADLF